MPTPSSASRAVSPELHHRCNRVTKYLHSGTRAGERDVRHLGIATTSEPVTAGRLGHVDHAVLCFWSCVPMLRAVYMRCAHALCSPHTLLVLAHCTPLRQPRGMRAVPLMAMWLTLVVLKPALAGYPSAGLWPEDFSKTGQSATGHILVKKTGPDGKNSPPEVVACEKGESVAAAIRRVAGQEGEL